MDDLTLQIVEDVAAGSPGAFPTTIRAVLLPQLERARSISEAEAAIRACLDSVPWIGDTGIGDAAIREARDRGGERMLAMQDAIELLVTNAADAVTAREVLVAHETLRRLLVVSLRVEAMDASQRPEAKRDVPGVLLPFFEYVRTVSVRLVLLIVSIEHLANRGPNLIIAELANKAFETSQTLRRTLSSAGIDLTPWADAPAETRARRIAESARVFWNNLTNEQRTAVDEALGERVEIPPRWPRQPS